MRALAIVALAAAACRADYTETFAGGTNLGGWGWGTGGEVIEPTGGNPGEYLRDSFLDTFAPQLHTALGVASEFTGDYAARGIATLSVDLALFYVDFSAEGRPLSLILRSENGTPGDIDDDWGAYLVGPENIPLVGEGWKSYSFAIDSKAAALPSGWKWIAFGPSSPSKPEWPKLISGVDQVQFFYGDPDFFFIFQVWDVGADNIGIAAACAPDCEGDGDLDIFDFLCFQGEYANQTAYADCEKDGDWDIFDFLCFQGLFAQGCD